MWKRFVAVMMLAVALVACQESKPNNQSLIIGQGNVKVLDLRIVSSGDSSAQMSGGTITYLITRVELTNTTPQNIYPVADHFYLTDASARRYVAVDTGSSSFAGISNDASPIKPGDKRTFTVGFRADPNVTGTVAYDY